MADFCELLKNGVRPLLDVIDDLKEFLKSPNLPIPTIVTLGMQSSGKSSTLESITHIKLPQGEGTVTIAPIEIQLRNIGEDKDEYAIVGFAADMTDSKEVSLNDVAEAINEYQNKLKVKKGLREGEKRLFKDKILVRVFRHNAPDLTLIDLPGLTHDENIDKMAKDICLEYIRKPENTVLFILNAEDDVSNSFANVILRENKDAKNRSVQIITKSDKLKDKDFRVYYQSLKDCKIKHKPAFIVNKFQRYEGMSYEEFKGIEMNLLNEIPRINEYRDDVYLGTDALIKLLCDIQLENIKKVIGQISQEVGNQLEKNKKELEGIPEPCKDLQEYIGLITKLMGELKENLYNRNENVKSEAECKDDNEKLLIRFWIDRSLKEFKASTEKKLNRLFMDDFTKKVTMTVVQRNGLTSDFLPDKQAYKILTRPEVEECLREFEIFLEKCYDYVTGEVKKVFENTFGQNQRLLDKVKKLFDDYSKEEKDKALQKFENIKDLELSNNIITFNDDVFTKQNQLNYIIMRGIIKNKFEDKKKDREKDRAENSIKSQLQSGTEIKPNTSSMPGPDASSDEKDIIDNKEQELNGFDIVNKINQKMSINDNMIKIYKKNLDTYCFKNSSEYYPELPTQIGSNYDEMSTYGTRVEKAFSQKKKGIYKPPYYISIGNLESKVIEDFRHKLNKSIHNNVANIIVTIVSYLSVMLNRSLDYLYLIIKVHFHDNLLKDKMQESLSRELLTLGYEKGKDLFENSDEDIEKRKRYKKNIDTFKEALRRLDEIKRNK